MQEKSIELLIAGRQYPLKIKESEVDVVQKAAELINHKLKDLEATYGVKDIQNLLAMTALQVATQLIDVDQNHTGLYKQLYDTFNGIESLLDSAIQDPIPELSRF
jgi:cell division protein ZapA (FtsZ GTPase activity inhibitor)